MNFPSKVLLDSDTLSFYIKHFPKVVAVAQNYLRQHQFFTFSIITRFEILRGMKANGATTGIKPSIIYAVKTKSSELTIK